MKPYAILDKVDKIGNIDNTTKDTRDLLKEGHIILGGRGVFREKTRQFISRNGHFLPF